VADHCEDPTLAAGGAMHEGIVSTRLGLKGIPSAAEEIMVARNILLADLTGGHVHLCHMSTRGSIELIRRGKEKGIRVTAEACPHHFTLTHERCEGYDTNAKMNPPLREPEDREAIRQAIRDGTIDAICTDHAPHHYDAKEREFDNAPNGIIGLETALGLAISELVETGLLTLPDLVNRMSTMPARIFNLPGGTLAAGAPADVLIADPKATWAVNPAEFFSKSRNTPFTGRRLIGRAEVTIVRGQVVFQRGN
jgi:dihydroorotase